MPKVRKLRRKKKFRTNINRKRLRNKLSKLPDIGCKKIKEAWEVKRSTVSNLADMGLAIDPNRVLKIPNVKNEMLKFVKNDIEEVDSGDEDMEEEKKVPEKVHVAQSLEEDAKHPRAKLFRLPNNEIYFITYMMDKYGDDYKAMVRDRKNYNQLTWKQIRAKIERFKSIPEQYAEYLVQKGEIVLEDPTPLKKIKPDILKEPIEKKTDSRLSRRNRKKDRSLIEAVWQEESVNNDESFDIDSTNKTADDIEEIDISNNQTNGEKKLQLFSDDEDNNENDDDDDDFDMKSDVSDSEDKSDNVKKIKLNKEKVSKLVKRKASKRKN